MNPRVARGILLALLLAATLLVYLPVLSNGFTNWDDEEYVTANPAVREFDAKRLLTGIHVANWHPLTMVLYAVEYRLFGLDPRGYHATSLVLHLAAVALVWMVVLRLAGSLAAASAAALIFGIHPLHVEPVAWISGQKDLLSALFFLGALLAYLHARDTLPGRFPATALLLFAAALLAKPMAVSLPLVLLLCDWYLHRPIDRRRLLQWLPFALLAATVSGITLAVQGLSGAVRTAAAAPLGERLLVSAHALLFYLGKLFWPVNLSAFYPLPAEGSALPLSFRLAPLGVAALAAAVVWFRGRSRLVTFAAGLYLVMLLPVLGLVRVGGAFAADRYLYLPALGPLLLAGVLLARTGTSLPGRAGTTLAATLLVAVALPLGWVARERTLVWRDSLTLWSDVLIRHPDTPLALTNRGNAWADRLEWGRALEDYDRAARLTTGSPSTGLGRSDAKPLYNRGVALHHLGRLTGAEAAYRQALAVDPTRREAWTNLGLVLASLRRPTEAEAAYREALRLEPASVDTRLDLGLLLAETNRPEAAVALYRESLLLHPGDVDLRLNLAADLEGLGREAEAAAEYRRVLELAPGHPLALQGLARLALH